MYTTEALEIAGYGQQPVPHTFFRQAQPAKHLGIVLPGWGYTPQMPLLYYAINLLLDMGADVIQAEYAYNRRADFQTLAEAEQAQWLFADATAVYRAALAQGAYRQITLVGKSLGTLAMGHLLTTTAVQASIRAVWLTPTLREALLVDQIRQWGGPSLFVIGTADPHYDSAVLTAVESATAGTVLTIDGATHSLELDDVYASLRALEQMLYAMQRFLT